MSRRARSGAFVTMGAVGPESGIVCACSGSGTADAAGAVALGAVPAGVAASEGATASAASSRRQIGQPLGPNANACRSQRARISKLTSPRAFGHGDARLELALPRSSLKVPSSNLDNVPQCRSPRGALDDAVSHERRIPSVQVRGQGARQVAAARITPRRNRSRELLQLVSRTGLGWSVRWSRGTRIARSGETHALR